MQHGTPRIKAQTSLDLMGKKTCTYTVKHWPLSDNMHSFTQNRNNGLPDAIRLGFMCLISYTCLQWTWDIGGQGQSMYLSNYSVNCLRGVYEVLKESWDILS